MCSLPHAGGKLLRGLLTVYASLAANREVQFAQPAESGAATAASAAAAALPSVFHLATAHAGGGAAPVYTGAATASAGAAAVEEAFNSGACVLGWGVELLQAAFLVADDQMDGAYTRRGKICWYRRQEVGPANAINDAVFLIFSIHQSAPSHRVLLVLLELPPLPLLLAGSVAVVLLLVIVLLFAAAAAATLRLS